MYDGTFHLSLQIQWRSQVLLSSIYSFKTSNQTFLLQIPTKCAQDKRKKTRTIWHTAYNRSRRLNTDAAHNSARKLHIPSLISMPCADTGVCPQYPSESSEAQQAAFGLTRSRQFQWRTKCQEQSDRLESYPGRTARKGSRGPGARRKDTRTHEIPFGHREGCESVFWLGGASFFPQKACKHHKTDSWSK